MSNWKSDDIIGGSGSRSTKESYYLSRHYLSSACPLKKNLSSNSLLIERSFSPRAFPVKIIQRTEENGRKVPFRVLHLEHSPTTRSTLEEKPLPIIRRVCPNVLPRTLLLSSSTSKRVESTGEIKEKGRSKAKSRARLERIQADAGRLTKEREAHVAGRIRI